MSRPDLSSFAEAERRELADLLAGLSPAEWEAPTLCPDWTVRDVVAHVFSYEDLRPRHLVILFARGRMSIARVNELALTPFRGSTPEELLDRVRTHPTPRDSPPE